MQLKNCVSMNARDLRQPEAGNVGCGGQVGQGEPLQGCQLPSTSLLAAFCRDTQVGQGSDDGTRAEGKLLAQQQSQQPNSTSREPRKRHFRALP